MRMKKFTIAFLTAFTLTGCATIMSGTTQSINLQAIDEANNEIIPGAVCSVMDGKGLRYAVNSNPGQFTVTKGNGALNPTCKKEGYIQSSFGVGDSFNAVTLVNVLFWPGFIVDAVSGAIKDYPSHMTVYMKRK